MLIRRERTISANKIMIDNSRDVLYNLNQSKDFTAPSVSKKQGKMNYTIQLRDKKSGKMLHYPMTIVVYHKPVETNTDQ